MKNEIIISDPEVREEFRVCWDRPWHKDVDGPNKTQDWVHCADEYDFDGAVVRMEGLMRAPCRNVRMEQRTVTTSGWVEL